MPQLPALVLVLVPLLAGAATAEPNPERVRKERHVMLSNAPSEIRVAPGVVTILILDSNLDRESVELDRTLFALVDVGERTINVEPLALLKGDVVLRVRFADASRPEAKLTLVSHPSEVDSQVRVFRDPRSPEAMQVQVAELEARRAACESELAALRERNKATGAAGMVLAKQIGAAGVRVARFKKWSGTGSGGLRTRRVRRYLSDSWVVLEVEAENTSNQPWRAEEAWLVSESTGTRVKASTVAMEPEALFPDGTSLVAVEFSGPPGQLGEVFRLVMHGSNGNQPLSVDGLLVMDGAQEKSR